MSVKVGVVGVGIGAMHLRSLALIPEAEVIAIADLNLERAQQFADKAGANAYPDWRAMLDGEPELQAVVLATPAVIRKEPIAAICERKLALFCEKPPALNIDDAREISKIIEAAGIINTVGFMYRWSAAAERMRALVHDRPKLFARIVVAWPVFSWVAGGGAPKSLYKKGPSGGPLIEQAVHFVDVLRYITGDEPVSVQAMAELGNIAQRDDRDCEETTAYIMRHESGMLSANIHNWSHEGATLQLQVVGQHFDVTWHMEHDALRIFGKVDGAAIEESTESDYYFREIVGFIKAVEAGDQGLLRSSYADATQTLAVCAAATTAIGSGDTVAVGR